MRRSDEHILVITDGSLASLLACLIAESEVGGADGAAGGSTRLAVALWLAPPEAGLFHHSVQDSVARQFVEHQIEALSLGDLVVPCLDEIGPLAATRALLRTAEDAMARGCQRVIWPCAWGQDLEAVHIASERALGIAQLASLDGGVGVEAEGPTIETPFVDCTAEMLLQLADDLDAPLGSCWLNPREVAALEHRRRGTGLAGETAAFAGERQAR
ncbi:MAG: hypothetical protein KDA20_01520 [Phycisphaerales bacterium]|nr:hypothetical protein [Phycisphaerales bacterium]